jgi:hypothetical protein
MKNRTSCKLKVCVDFYLNKTLRATKSCHDDSCIQELTYFEEKNPNTKGYPHNDLLAFWDDSLSYPDSICKVCKQNHDVEYFQNKNKAGGKISL